MGVHFHFQKTFFLFNKRRRDSITLTPYRVFSFLFGREGALGRGWALINAYSVCSLSRLHLPVLAALKELVLASLRWLEIVSWCARPGPLNTATKSRPMHATIQLKMEYVARARASAPGSCMRKIATCALEIFEKFVF